MQRIRLIAFVLTVSILSIGYFASQYAYFQGLESVQSYYLKVASPAVSTLAFVALIAIVVLTVLNFRDHEDKEQ